MIITQGCHDFRARYTDADIIALNQMHTKQLLKKRDGLYCVSEFCADCCSREDPECLACWANLRYNKEQIKQILATREHILNKKESKELRKQRIRQGR